MTGRATLTLDEGRTERTSGLIVTAREGGANVTEITLAANRNYHPQPQPIDMAPVVASPPASAPPRPVSCAIQGGTAVVRNGTIEARFATDGERLHLTSLRHLLDGTQMLRSPEDAWLFLVEVADERFAGSRDFTLEGIDQTEGGFVAHLRHDDPALAATLAVTIEDEGLRMAMSLRTRATSRWTSSSPSRCCRASRSPTHPPMTTTSTRGAAA